MKKRYKEVKNFIIKSNEEALKGYLRSSVVKGVEVLPAKNACDACKEWEGKKIALKEAIKKPPLPIRNCHNEKYGYCRCTYIAVID